MTITVSNMRRSLRCVLVWLAALAWVAGWGVHAGMALAQAAGESQICSTQDKRVPAAPAKAGGPDCACCVQALAAAVPSTGEIDPALLHPARGERAQSPRLVIVERARRLAAHAPRAPPVA